MGTRSQNAESGAGVDDISHGSLYLVMSWKPFLVAHGCQLGVWLT